MNNVTYRVIEHDGGWTYKQGKTFSATYATHDQAKAAASLACREQSLPGEDAFIEYQAADGHWIMERAVFDDRPHIDVQG